MCCFDIIEKQLRTYWFIFLFFYFFICLFVYLSICLFVYLSICLFVYLSICLFVYWSIGLLVYWSIGLFVYLSICLLVYLSNCLTVQLPIDIVAQLYFRLVFLASVQLSCCQFVCQSRPICLFIGHQFFFCFFVYLLRSSISLICSNVLYMIGLSFKLKYFT